MSELAATIRGVVGVVRSSIRCLWIWHQLWDRCDGVPVELRVEEDDREARPALEELAQHLAAQAAGLDEAAVAGGSGTSHDGHGGPVLGAGSRPGDLAEALVEGDALCAHRCAVAAVLDVPADGDLVAAELVALGGRDGAGVDGAAHGGVRVRAVRTRARLAQGVDDLVHFFRAEVVVQFSH